MSRALFSSWRCQPSCKVEPLSGPRRHEGAAPYPAPEKVGVFSSLGVRKEPDALIQEIGLNPPDRFMGCGGGEGFVWISLIGPSFPTFPIPIKTGGHLAPVPQPRAAGSEGQAVAHDARSIFSSGTLL